MKILFRSALSGERTLYHILPFSQKMGEKPYSKYPIIFFSSAERANLFNVSKKVYHRTPIRSRLSTFVGYSAK